MSPFVKTVANPGLLVGASFGTVFLLANSGPPLPAPAGVAIKAVGVLSLLAVAWAQAAGGVAGHPSGFGRAFWLVVGAEALLGIGGLVGLRTGGAPVQANVAWVALVVGGHFVALAVVWRDAGIAAVGSVMAIAGGTGLTMAAAGTGVAYIPAVSGVVSGFALLIGSLVTSVGARRRQPLVHHPTQATGHVSR